MLTGLRILRLSHNRLDVLPEAIGELTNLESLSVDDNVLESLPRTLGTCHKLKRILAFSNKIVTMPLGALGGLSMLQVRAEGGEGVMKKG